MTTQQADVKNPEHWLLGSVSAGDFYYTGIDIHACGEWNDEGAESASEDIEADFTCYDWRA